MNGAEFIEVFCAFPDLRQFVVDQAKSMFRSEKLQAEAVYEAWMYIADAYPQYTEEAYRLVAMIGMRTLSKEWNHDYRENAA